jgi:hypothetical protein
MPGPCFLSAMTSGARAFSLGSRPSFMPRALAGRRFADALRLRMWRLGLLGWFGGGIVSFAHAVA